MLLFLGLSEDPVQITSIQLLPDPPKPGQDLTVIVDGTVSETLEVGSVFDDIFSAITSTGRSICRRVCEAWIS